MTKINPSEKASALPVKRATWANYMNMFDGYEIDRRGVVRVELLDGTSKVIGRVEMEAP